MKKPGIHVTYGYDALGRRAWRKSEAGTTTYLWHNDVLMGEQNPEGQWQWYIRDPKTEEPLLTLIDGEPHYYELDWRTMPIRLWDEGGNLLWQGNANAWGHCRPETPAGPIHQPLRLPGQFEDELTGFHHNRYREYDRQEGRYLTPDPLGVQGGLNPYRYTRNPADYIDPLGLSYNKAITPDNAVEAEEAVTQSVAAPTGIIAPPEPNHYRDTAMGPMCQRSCRLMISEDNHALLLAGT
ncbi:RHS repeat-associated core domain-containing protein [Marinobacter lacisalsi]